MTVHEVSEKTGVSIRALRHYDAIGLLKPAALSEAGYRLYDVGSLERLQLILLFRELQFPLKAYWPARPSTATRRWTSRSAC